MLSAKESSLNTAGPCQSPELIESSSPYPRLLTRLRLAFWYAQREGVVRALGRIATALVPFNARSIAIAGHQGSITVQAIQPSVDGREVLNLQPGEWVEVRSRAEIMATLDSTYKHRGLRFVPEMFDFCGQRMRVLRRVEKICIENTPDVRTIRNTVLLEGGVCQGGGIGCDRSCFHFWREIWLKRLAS
jgi:hypothetical protein